LKNKVILAFFIIVFYAFRIVFGMIRLVFFLKRKLFKPNTGKKPKFLLYLENFPIENSGYQNRSLKWARLFNESGYHCEVRTIYESKEKFDRKLFNRNLSFFFISAMWIRFRQCFYARQFECVIVRRELLQFNDYGNLFMEKFLNSLHQNVIIDFDDDIAAAKNQPKQITNFFARLLMENGNKFNESLRLHKRFIVASEYLKEKVLTENKKIAQHDVLIIPTCVDYNKYPPKQYPEVIDRIVFGWIGADNNYPLLDMLLPVFNRLAASYNFKLLVIAGTEYKRDTLFEIEFMPWSLKTEVENLYQIDVGLMPLRNNAEDKGKGGFKLIQYMGLGIVSVAAALTINCDIIENGVDSFLASSDDDWEQIFVRLLKNEIDFAKTGQLARNKIMQSYTFEANKTKYLGFLTQKSQSVI
jgi:glycosyltransferase involved in cell wall biosynthesis